MGHITEYDDVNVGVHRSRSVAGTLFMWNTKTRKNIWETTNKVKNSKWALSRKKILLSFLKGIGKSFLERFGNKPLIREAELFARKSMESLPFKP